MDVGCIAEVTQHNIHGLIILKMTGKLVSSGVNFIELGPSGKRNQWTHSVNLVIFQHPSSAIHFLSGLTMTF